MTDQERQEHVENAAASVLKAWRDSESAIETVLNYCWNNDTGFTWDFYFAVSGRAKKLWGSTCVTLN